jgi:hypothetical protein
MERVPVAGSKRRRAIAVGGGRAALIALVALFTALLEREPRDDGLEPYMPSGARERALESDAVAPGRAPAERLPAPETESAEPNAAASPALHGSVLDAAGAPVAGAAVEAAPEGLATLARSAPTGRTAGATLADGNFELHVEDGDATYRLRVLADGFFPEIVESILPSAAPITVRLRAAPSLVGTVRTTAGSAVAGARVRLLARTNSSELLELETESDESGRYRLSGGLLDLQHLEDPLRIGCGTRGFRTRRSVDVRWRASFWYTVWRIRPRGRWITYCALRELSTLLPVSTKCAKELPLS